MKRIISLLLSTIITASTFICGTSVVSAADNTQESEYLVLTESNSALNKTEKLSSTTENIFSSDETYISTAVLSKNDVDVLKHTNGVIAVEKNIPVQGSTINGESEADVIDCLFTDASTSELNLWYLDAVGSESVSNADKVKIEILDSGVNYSSDIDVKERINLIDGENYNPLYEDFSGHGTSMASVIGAKNNGKGVTGINPNAEMYSVRALDDNIQAPISRIVEGIQWGIDNNMNIINMSFGTNTNSTILREVIQQAYNAGILLISATGNNSNTTVQYPAAYTEVLAVGSMNENSEISDFTSVGDEMDIVAPGEKIETAGIFGTITGTNGTSIATAEVSAVASKILEKDNTKSPDFVKSLLLASAKSIQDGNITTGAVDGDYALEMYDDFENSYTPNSNIEYNNPDEPTTYDTDGVVEGLWSKAKHAEMAGDAASDWLNVTTNQLNLIKAGAKAADYNDLEDYIDFGKAMGFHGTGNYVANLRCVLKFIDKLRTTNNIDTAHDKAMELAESLPVYSSSSNAQIIDDLLERFLFLNTTDFSKDFNVIDNLSVTSAKYKAIGLCLHMVGDIYAHRTQVPTSCTSQIMSTGYFTNLSNFSATTVAQKQALVDAAQNNSVPLTPVDLRGKQALQTSISYGVVEFRDIKRYCKQWYANNSCGVNGANEDNPQLFPLRYEDAEITCYTLLANYDYTGKFELSIWDLVTVPDNNGTCDKLSNLKKNSEKAGFDTTELTTTQWNQCTAYPKKVDANGNIVNK